MTEKILDICNRVRSRESEKRMHAGIKGLISELNEKEPDIDLWLDMKQYAAIESGRIVQCLREEASLTQRQLANHLRVTQQFISKIESGKLKNGVPLSILLSVARACDADLKITWESKRVKTKLDDNIVPIVRKNRSDALQKRRASK